MITPHIQKILQDEKLSQAASIEAQNIADKAKQEADEWIAAASQSQAMTDVERDRLVLAFIHGAKWWEFHKTGFTMWQSDQNLALHEARKRHEHGTLGVDPIEAAIKANVKLSDRQP